MATRGQIAYLADSNSIFSIYINFDAYPESLGKILTTHFNSDDQAQNVVMDGYDIRGIDEDGTVERYDKGGAKQITDNEPQKKLAEFSSLRILETLARTSFSNDILNPFLNCLCVYYIPKMIICQPFLYASRYLPS